MKKFSFSLEIVKRLRADAEQQAQAALGRSIAAHRAAQEARDARARSLEVAQSQLAQPSALAHELARAERERSAAELRFGAASVERRKAEDGVVHTRGELAEASRSLEILERLERKRRSEHRAAALAEEEQIVQEIAEARRARRRAA